jgi:hypothetical protein
MGVTFVSDGNWTVHIENIARSALKQVNVLRKLKFILSKQALLVFLGLKSTSHVFAH